MAYAAKHNGRRLQTSTNFLQFGGLFPFLNWVKGAADRAFADTGSIPVEPIHVDANGYPNTDINGGQRILFFGPDPLFARPGNRVIKWTGTGSPALGITHTAVSGSLTPVAGVGRYEFTTPNARFDIVIDSHVKNLVVCHVEDEAKLAAGEVFSDDAKKALGYFGHIRFLDWQLGNTTNVTTWATRKPVDYLYYAGDELRASLYAATAMVRSGLNYSCTGYAGFTKADKATIIVKVQDSFNGSFGVFTNGSDIIAAPSHGLTSAQVGAAVYLFDEYTSDGLHPSTFPSNFANAAKYYIVSVPTADTLKLSDTSGGAAKVASGSSVGNISINPVITLNVSGTGAAPILSEGGGFLIKGFNNYPTGGTYQSLATLVYDAALGGYVKVGGDASASATGLHNGVPPELMVRLCAEVGAHPHFVTPMFAALPATDYMPSLAAHCRDNGPAWMVPDFEGPNELWNTAYLFYQTVYANNSAVARGWGNDFHNWYGAVMSTLGQSISPIYSGDRTKFGIVAGIQTATGGNSDNDPRVLSTKFIGTTAQAAITGPWGSINISTAPGTAEANRWITKGSCATYVTPSAYGTADEATMAAAFGGAYLLGSINGDTLTVLSVIDDSALAAGKTIQGQGAAGAAILSSTTILAFGAGGTTGTGGAGTYKLSKPQPGLTTEPFYMCAWADFSQADAYVDTLMTGGSYTSIPDEKLNYAGIKAFFKAHGIKRMVAYEGGYSPDVGTVPQIINRLRTMSKLSPRLRIHMWTNYVNFISMSDGDFVAEAVSFFILTGGIDRGKVSSAWSVLDDLYQNPKPPIWQAIEDITVRGARLNVASG